RIRHIQTQTITTGPSPTTAIRNMDMEQLTLPSHASALSSLGPDRQAKTISALFTGYWCSDVE
ncbi:hypothetical protein ACEQ6A_35660, partial [Rhizobium brockwellii]|uniref:hypothetical protein n=1 Tax=Rhizobium brockwellii TaxID=3019932 RepID=UPI003F965086